MKRIWTIESRLIEPQLIGVHDMADPVWFYARGEVERGPFTLPQIRALANASKLRPDDLVWKEGMENWTAARDIVELFPQAGLVGDQSGSNGMGIPVESRAKSSDAAAKSSPGLSDEVRSAFHRVGRVLTLLGSIFVVATYGCESLSERRVARISAVAELNALNSGTVTQEEKDAARRAELEHQASSLARGIALQMGLLVLLSGAVGLLILADRYERWLGVGVILIIVFSALRALGDI
jgi:hypothetical protein